MYGAIREYQGPSGVTHALRGRFGPPDSSAWGIVFIKRSSIELYNVRANDAHARLDLLGASSLPSQVFSASALRRPSATQDFLWIGFSAMRVAALAWDPAVRDWHTVQSIDLAAVINRQAAAMKGSTRDSQRPMSSVPGDGHRVLLRGYYSSSVPADLRVDDRGRCVAVLGEKLGTLMVLPMRSDADLANAAANSASSSDAEPLVHESDMFSIDLKDEYGVANVKDFVFLADCFEPTVLLVHEPKRTWAGRVSVLRNTAEIIAISIDLRSKRHAKAWEMKSLPSDAHKVVAVPGKAGGGVLVFSPNTLMQVRHEACAAGLSLNSFGDAYAKEVESTYGTIVKSKTLLSLDAARCAFLDMPDASTALVSLKGGELYFLTVAGKSRNSISMVRAGSTVLASAIVPVNERFFILASRISDSLLVEYRQCAVARSIAIENGASAGDPSETPKKSVGGDADPMTDIPDGEESAKKTGKRSSKKRRRTADEEAEYEMLYGSKPPPESDSESDGEDRESAVPLELVDKDEGTRGVYDDEDELGVMFSSGGNDDDRGSIPSARSDAWSLVVKDTLTSYGPSADLAVGKSAGSADGALDFVVAGGYAKNGCLGVLQQSIRPRDVTRFALQGFTGAWTVRDPSLSRREANEREERNAKRTQRNETIRERNERVQAERGSWVAQKVEALKLKAAEEKARFEEEKRAAEPEAGKGEKPSESGSGDGDTGEKVDGKDKGEISSGEPRSKRAKADVDDVDIGDMPRIRKIPAAESTKMSKSEAGGDAQQSLAEKAVVAVEVPTPEQLTFIEGEADEKFTLEVEEVLEETVADVADLHSYLLLSTSTSTVVMKTGDDLEQVAKGVVDFLTDVGTLAAGNVLGQAAIVQVHSRGVRLLQDARVSAVHDLVSGSPAISSAHVADPYVMLLLANGSVVVLKVSADMHQRDCGAHGASGVDNGDIDDVGGLFGTSQAGTSQSAEYSNVTLPVDFTLEPAQAGNRVASACLYIGPITPEASRKVVQGDAAGTDGTALQSSPNAPEDGNAPVESAPMPDIADDMDEEERMLYGDGVADEGSYAKQEEVLGIDSKSNRTGEVADGSGDDTIMGGNEAIGGDSESVAIENGVDHLPKYGSAASGSRDEAMLVTSTKDGALEMRDMNKSGYPVLFRYAHFFLAPQLLTDDGCEAGQSHTGIEFGNEASAPQTQQGKVLKAKKKDRISSLLLANVTGTALVPGLRTPVLVAVQASGFPLVYRAYLAPQVSTNGREQSPLRLTRVATEAMTMGILKASSASNNSVAMVPFENVAGRGGVFVGGKCPFFVFAERGYPRAHRMRCPPVDDENSSAIDTLPGVTAFAELHNVNCPRGFVTITHDGVVGVSELPSPAAVNMDAPTPFRKVPLRCTPHKVAYHAGSSTYGVLASMPTLTTREERLARILQSLEKHDKRHYESTVAQAEAETGDERLVRIPPLYEELHELRVYRPEGWQLIKSYKLKKGEVGLSIANISVDVYKQRDANSGVHIPSTNRLDDGSESLFAASIKMRPKNMLVVGTGFLNGEDATSRGRLLMFEVSRQEIFSEASGSYTAFQLQLIAEKELPAPVTAVAPMEGYVVAGVGPQLGVYKLVQDEIVYLSFAFGQLFCTSIASVKHYVVSADMYKSISFHFFRERNTSVNFLGKDYAHNMSYATEYLIDNGKLSMIMSDAVGNVQLLNYAHAMVPESRGGKRLLLNGGVNFGSRINKFQRVRIEGSLLVKEEEGQATAGRHATMFVTLDGGIGAVVPINEQQYQQLERLTDVMINAQDVARHAGLDPKDARTFRPASSSTQILNQRLIDTRLALEALLLSPVRTRTVSTMAGLTLDELVSLCSYLDAVLLRF